jgi:hypothetical protein
MQTLTSAGPNQDVFVVSFDPNGTHRWSGRFGGNEGDLGMAIAVDATGHVIVAGEFSGTADFGSGLLTSVGAADIFLLRRAP